MTRKYLTLEQRARAYSLWRAGMRTADMAQLFGRTVEGMRSVLKRPKTFLELEAGKELEHRKSAVWLRAENARRMAVWSDRLVK